LKNAEVTASFRSRLGTRFLNSEQLLSRARVSQPCPKHFSTNS
jgi:hypothetical protein